jgi:hypothetical protein
MTQPENKPGQSEYPVVHMVCRRGGDQRTAGQKCDGRQAWKISQDGSRNVLLKCCKCNYSWNVPVGGHFSL